MADYTTPDPWDVPAREGAFVPEPPRQGPIDYVRDTLLDTARGVVGVGTSAAALAGDRDTTDFGNALSWKLKQWKSDRGQYVEDNPDKSKGGFTDEVVQAGMGIVPYILPTIGATVAGGAAAGPVGAFAAPTATLAGLTVGDTRAKLRDQIRYAREEEIVKSPIYQQARADGLTDEQARDRVYDTVSNDPTLLTTVGIAGAIGGGLTSRVAGRFMSKSVAETITQRVMQNVGAGLPQREAAQAVAQGFQREAAQAVAAKRAQLAAGEITQKEFDAFTRDLASRWSLKRGAIGATEAFVGGIGQMAPQHYAEQSVMADQNLAPAPTVAGAVEHSLKPSLAFGLIGGASHIARRGGTYRDGQPATRPADRMGEELNRTAEQQQMGAEYGAEFGPEQGAGAPPPRPQQEMTPGDLGMPGEYGPEVAPRQGQWTAAQQRDPNAAYFGAGMPEMHPMDIGGSEYGPEAAPRRGPRAAAPGDFGLPDVQMHPADVGMMPHEYGPEIAPRPGQWTPAQRRDPNAGYFGAGMPEMHPKDLVASEYGSEQSPRRPGPRTAVPSDLGIAEPQMHPNEVGLSEYGWAREPQKGPRRGFPRQMRVEDITPDASLERFQMLRNDRSGAGEALLRRQERLEQQAREESGIEKSREDPHNDQLYDYIESQPHLAKEAEAIRRGITDWEKSEAGVTAAREALVERRRREAAEARGVPYEPKAPTSQGKGKATVDRVRAKRQQKAPPDVTGQTGAQVMQRLGIMPHEAGRGEERLLPEAANLRALGLLTVPPGRTLRARSPFMREISVPRKGLTEKALRLKAAAAADSWVRKVWPTYGMKDSKLTAEQKELVRKQRHDYAEQLYQHYRATEGAILRPIDVERRGLPPGRRATARSEERRAAVERLREQGRELRRKELAEKEGIRAEIMPPTTPQQRAEAVAKRKAADLKAIERRQREMQHEAEVKAAVDSITKIIVDAHKELQAEATAEREGRTGAERHRAQMAEEYAAREKMAQKAATEGNTPEALNALLAGVRGPDGKVKPKDEREVLRAFADAAAARVRNAAAAYGEWERKRTEQGKKPRIRLGIANRSQFHLWHDRISFYNKFASDARAAADRLSEALGRNNRTSVVEARKRVSKLINDFYEAEGMLHSERAGEWHQAQYKEANKRRESYERDLLARIKAIDPAAHDEAARSLEQVHLPTAAELGLKGEEADAYRSTVENRRGEYEDLMRSIGEMEEERMSAGEARTVSLFETREEAAALDEAQALARDWGTPMAWRGIPDVYSMNDPAALIKARQAINELLPSDKERAARGLPPMDPEVRERIKREVAERVAEMRRQNTIEEDRQRGEDLEAQRKGGVPARTVLQQANVEGREYGAEMTRRWSQHMADRYAEEARLREREREAEDAQNAKLATQWNGGVRRDDLPRDHPAYLTLDGLREIEREAKADYDRVMNSATSERTDGAADRARREWFTLNADERRLLQRYEESHVTSVRDHLSIKEKVEFQRGLEERIRALAEQKKKDPEHFLQDFMQDRGAMLSDRAQQLFNALDMVTPNFRRMTQGEMINLYGELRRAMGESYVPLTRVTPDVIMRDMERASAQLERIETEMRKSWELQQRVGLAPEYGIKSLLDPTADLTAEGTVPRGAHVTTVGKYFGNSSSTYGMRDAFKVSSNKGRMVDGVRSSLLRHFMDVANKVVGHIEVVHVSDEQMRILADERKLPPETPSFYDPITDRIFATHEVMKSSQRGRVMVHEVAHALTESAMQKYPAVVQRFEEIRRAVKAAYNNPKHEAHEAVRLTLGDHPQALENVHEFVSEFWANDKVSLALGELETTGAQRARWQTKRRETALNRMVFAIKSALMKAFGVGSQKKMLNDATITALDMLQRFEDRGRQRPFVTDQSQARPIRLTGEGMRETVTKLGDGALDKLANITEGLAKFGFLRNLNEHMRRIDPQLAEKGDRIADILGRTQSEQAKIEREIDRPVMRSLLEALHKGDPNLRSDRLLDYMNTERYAKVFGSSELHRDENAWVDRNNPMHQQSIAQHARVREMWNRLTPEEQAVVKQTRGAMAQRHEDILNTTLNSLIKNSKWLENNRPAAVEAVRKLIRGEELADADTRALDADRATAHSQTEFDEWVSEMKSIPAFRKIEGPYYPLMRHGDFIVSGRYDLKSIIDEYNRSNPGDRIAGREGDRENRWEFGSNAERDRFIRFVSEHPEFQFNITSAGNEYVVVNTDHFSAHENRRDAERELADLQSDPTGGRHFIPRVVTRRRDAGADYGPRNQGMHAVEKLVTSLKNSSYYRSLDPVERNIMVRNIEEIGYRSMLSSAVRANIATRRYVRGASEDLARNVGDYLHKTSYVLAEQRLQPERMAAVADFNEEVRQREWMKDPVTGNPRDDMHQYGTKRSQYHREFLRRAALRPEERNKTTTDRAINVLLRLTSLAKLGSPSYHAMNALEPGMLGVPQLAGEHGTANASREMAAAYGIFGGHFVRNMKEDIARVWREGINGDPELVDHTKSIADRIREKGLTDGEDLVRMIDFLDQTGYLHRDAGMDIAKHYDPAQNWRGRLLDYVDNFQRAIGNAVEAQNRATTAIAAYRLERAAGKTHDEAVRYAQRTLEKTAGLYAWYNKPEMMNSANPMVRMATQFRNYSIRSIQNYALMTLGAYHHLRGNETNPEIADRNRLLARQLARQMAVQGLASGLMGTMFWAPVAAGTNLTSLIFGYNSDDLEHDIRAGLTDIIGKDATTFVTRGGLRLIGADFGGGLGERLSASSPLTYGTLGDKPDSWYAAVGHLIGGASADTAVKFVTGAQKIKDGAEDYANGRYTIGGEKLMQGMSDMMPVKAVADIIKVAQRSAYGEHAPSGAPLPEPSVAQVASNMLGFRTGTQVERQEAKTYFNREKKSYEKEALDIKRAFAMEQDPEARADIINRQRLEFNAQLPEAMRISREDMLKYAQQYAKQQKAPQSQLGLPVTRRTRPVLDTIEHVYRVE